MQVKQVRIILIGCLVSLLLAAQACAQGINPIQQENSLPGTAAWQITAPANNHEIEGYASAASINRGEQITFFVNTSDPSYQVEIYRMGWYQGLGARLVVPAFTLSGQNQAIPAPDSNTGLVECAWQPSYVLSTTTNPGDWVSGYYLAKLTGSVSGKQTYIIFVVRDDQRHAPLLLRASVNTYQAYNGWGGKSLYSYNSSGSVQAVKVSFNRPYLNDNNGNGAGQFFFYEYNAVRFVEGGGFDVSYSTDVDTHANGAELLWHKGIITVGHGEYWSWEMRTNLEVARDHGVNLAFLTADTCSWQVRFEPSTVDATPNRDIVAYKETALTDDPDMADPATSYLVTTLWGKARNGLRGWSGAELLAEVFVHAVRNQPIVVQNTSNWVFAGTGLRKGDTLPGLLGGEVDALQSFSPPGAIRLAHSPFVVNGVTYYSDMAVYQAPSGAWVFNAGTNWWSWGLDGWGRPSTYVPVNPAAQQMTRNVLNQLSKTP